MGTTSLSNCAELRIIIPMLSWILSLVFPHLTQWWALCCLLNNGGYNLSSSSSCWGWILSSSFRNNVADVSRWKPIVATTWYFASVDLNDVQHLHCSAILMQFLDLQPAPFPHLGAQWRKSTHNCIQLHINVEFHALYFHIFTIEQISFTIVRIWTKSQKKSRLTNNEPCSVFRNLNIRETDLSLTFQKSSCSPSKKVLPSKLILISHQFSRRQVYPPISESPTALGPVRTHAYYTGLWHCFLGF